MRSLFSVLQSFGSAGALHNARAELELTHSRNVQAAVLVRRVGTIDAVATRRDVAVPSQSIVHATA